MSRLILLPLALLVACSPPDPCTKYDNGICGKKEGCSVFNATQLGSVGTGWCVPPNALSEAIECMTTPPTECEAGARYASPADEDGNPTDTCYSYTGCEPPEGWVDCTTVPALDLEVCDG